jgi:hypothetical protein
MVGAPAETVESTKKKPVFLRIFLQFPDGALSPFPIIEMQHNKKRKRSMLILYGKSLRLEE